MSLILGMPTHPARKLKAILFDKLLVLHYTLICMFPRTRPTEWTYASDVKEWINNILPGLSCKALQRATVEEMPESSLGRADILIYNTTNEVHTVISVKRPEISALDEKFKAEAKDYAEKYRARFFVTHNVNILALWDGVTGKLIEQFPITYVRELAGYRAKTDEIKESFKGFLRWYKQRLELGQSPRPIDESIAEVLRQHVKGVIQETSFVSFIVEKAESNIEFRQQFDQWVLDQGWEKAKDRGEVEKFSETLAQQFIYILINKCIFYFVLRAQYPSLPDLTLPPDADYDYETFQRILQVFFTRAKEISKDYETIFDTNFIDTLPAPKETISEILKIIHYIKAFDYKGIGYDVIGKIYERLIMDEERHLMGQFFTPAHVADLILGFCLKDGSSIVMDPACGSGTFLVRAYQRLKFLGGRDSHQHLLAQLWGIDIARFPAHLATINLAIRDLQAEENYPHIVHKDFFDIEGSDTTIEIGIHGHIPLSLSYTAQAEIESLRKEKLKKEIPVMDAVVGNPPYTRHEELHEELFGENYKKKLQNRIKDDFPDLELSERAGIYTYFIPHGFKFLKKDGGRLGFVTLRQWLDTDYGESIREFVKRKSLIIAIIESQNERWFPDAQMLPIICIFERVKKPCAQHWVRFVQLKKKLEEFIPSLGEVGDATKEARHWEEIDKFVERIENADTETRTLVYTYEDRELRIMDSDDLRILMIRQEKLRSTEKWSKFLRAPAAYFKLLERAKGSLCPLEDLVEVKYGVKPGVTKFFCLGSARNPFQIKKTKGFYVLEQNGQRQYEIEDSYVFPAITKIKPHKKIKIEEGDGYLLSVAEFKEDLQLAKRKVLDYIKWGESPIYKLRGSNEWVGADKSPTCASRSPWYNLGLSNRKKPQIICPGIFWGRHIVFWNEAQVHTTDSQAEFHPKDPTTAKALCAILNSTFMALVFEFAGRNIENRDKTISNQIKIDEFRSIPCIDLRKLNSKIIKKLERAFDNISNRDVETLDKEIQKPDRTDLDKIVFIDILGLKNNEMQEIREATAQLFMDRIQRLQEGEIEEESD